MVERAERLDCELLLDRLEEVIGAASRMPFGSRVLVDPDDCASIIDQMRVALPVQLEEARRVIAERDLIIEQARNESEQMLQHAQQQVSHEALQHEIIREARVHAAEIEQRATADAQRQREEMDQYTRQVMQRLTARVEATLRALKTGMVELERGAPSAGRHTDEIQDEPPSAPRSRAPRHLPTDRSL